MLAMLAVEKYKQREIIWEPATNHSASPAHAIIAPTLSEVHKPIAYTQYNFPLLSPE
jgi:hypothetical protein